MIVVISSEKAITKELLWVNRLLESGLQYFHIRKPNLTDIELATYIGQIEADFRTKLVVHDRIEIAQDLGVQRLHLSERLRLQNYSAINDSTIGGLSTSVHSIADFNTLDEFWEYSFLSPVFASISKANYGQKSTILDQMKYRKNEKVKLIGLGGITAQNMRTTFCAGANGVALLGTIWESQHPVNTFKLCQSQDHMSFA